MIPGRLGGVHARRAAVVDLRAHTLVEQPQAVAGPDQAVAETIPQAHLKAGIQPPRTVGGGQPPPAGVGAGRVVGGVAVFPATHHRQRALNGVLRPSVAHVGVPIRIGAPQQQAHVGAAEHLQALSGWLKSVGHAQGQAEVVEALADAGDGVVIEGDVIVVDAKAPLREKQRGL